LCSLTYQSALKLSKRAHHVEYQASTCGLGVDSLAKGDKPNSSLFERRHEGDEMRKAAAQAIEAPGYQHIAWLYLGEKPIEGRPTEFRARDPCIAEDGRAPCAPQSINLQR
jgi:hypothetical protein